jgi:hypothetical protein
LGSLANRLSRLEGLERLVETRVKAGVRAELEAALGRLERHLTPEELSRVLEILADDEEPRRGA